MKPDAMMGVDSIVMGAYVTILNRHLARQRHRLTMLKLWRSRDLSTDLNGQRTSVGVALLLDRMIDKVAELYDTAARLGEGGAG